MESHETILKILRPLNLNHKENIKIGLDRFPDGEEG